MTTKKVTKTSGLTPFYSSQLPMRVAALMSGTGSNLVKLLENPANGKSYQIICVLTDNPQSNAKSIAKKFKIPYLENDIAAFYRKKGTKRSDLSVRDEFDQISVAKLSKFKPDVVAYCGYMSLASPTLVNAYLGVNVHPADLRILDAQGRRKFVGAHAVHDAILAGQKELRATTHLVSNETDQGAILMVSEAVPVRLPKGFDQNDAKQLEAVVRAHQERLKENGDFSIFSKTLNYLAEGRFVQDSNANVFLLQKKYVITNR